MGELGYVRERYREIWGGVRVTNKELLETVYVCKSEIGNWKDTRTLELIESDIDLLGYCKKFRNTIGIKCDYIDVINNIKLVLPGREKNQSMTDYLSRYLKLVGDLKLVYAKSFKDMEFLNEYVTKGELNLTKNFDLLKIIYVYDLSVHIKGKKCKLEVNEYIDHIRLNVNENETDIGAIFVKDKKFEFMRVKSYEDEVKVLKRVLVDSSSYNLVLVPVLSGIAFRLEDIDVDFNDNKLLLKYKELMDVCNLYGDEDGNENVDIKLVYDHVRNSDISMIDYYKLIPSSIGINTCVRLFDTIITMMESLKEKEKRERLKNHLLQVLKFRAYEDYGFESDILMALDNIDNVSIEESLLMFKNGNIDSIDLIERTYGKCNNFGKGVYESDLRDDNLVIIYDLDKKGHIFKASDKKVWEIVRSQKFLFMQGFFGTLYVDGEGWTNEISKMVDVLGRDREFWERAKEDVVYDMWGIKSE